MNVALVTGANRGIGAAIAEGLAERGYRVLLTARDLQKAAATAAPMRARGLAVDPHQLNVTDMASVAALTERLCTEYGRLDVLVNNAAILNDDGERALTIDLQLVEATLQTNLLGPWRLCQAVIPLMRAQGSGRIVNLSSDYGSLGLGGGPQPAYSVSKAALNMLTVRLARELQGTGILVNACNPGWVKTEMGGPNAELSPAEGADTPIWLATLPADGPTGGFFQRRRPLPW